jgi:hypothetical protein
MISQSFTRTLPGSGRLVCWQTSFHRVLKPLKAPLFPYESAPPTPLKTILCMICYFIRQLYVHSDPHVRLQPRISVWLALYPSSRKPIHLGDLDMLTPTMLCCNRHLRIEITSRQERFQTVPALRLLNPSPCAVDWFHSAQGSHREAHSKNMRLLNLNTLELREFIDSERPPMSFFRIRGKRGRYLCRNFIVQAWRK